MFVLVANKKQVISTLLVAVLVVVSLVYTQSVWGDALGVFAPGGEKPIYYVNMTEKKVAISFDAAWGDEKTDEILDILDRYNVKTTFFLVGYWVDKYPDHVKEMVARGHEIGNHSADHGHMSKMSAQEIRLDLADCNKSIKDAIQKETTLFRAPYGEYNDTVVKTAREMGFDVIQWSVDSLDWKDLTAEQMLKRCTQGVKNGDIMLFHNNSKYIIEALPLIIDKLQKDGYTIVRISDLIYKAPYTVDRQGVQRPATTPMPAASPAASPNPSISVSPSTGPAWNEDPVDLK